MVRSPYFDSNGMKRGAWSEEEDNKLRDYVERYGHTRWRLVPIFAGLARCGKSCRLRWMNYLKPGLKRGDFTKHEVDLIIKLHSKLGNKWSAIAARLPGRTDNDIKNYWHAHIKKSCKLISTVTATEQSSDEIFSFRHVTTGHHKEALAPTNLFPSAENSQNIDAVNLVARDEGDIWDDMYGNYGCGQLDAPISEEQLRDFMLCSDYSLYSGITSTAESQLNDAVTEDQPPETFSFCNITTGRHQVELASSSVILSTENPTSNGAAVDLVAQSQGDLWEEQNGKYGCSQLNMDLPPVLEDHLYDFEMWEMKDDDAWDVVLW